MRICVDKSGKLIEMQSHATEGTLIRNAINAGYKEADIEEKEITSEEWDIMQSEINKPSPEQVKIQEKESLIQAKIREQAITALKVEGKLDENGKIKPH